MGSEMCIRDRYLPQDLTRVNATRDHNDIPFNADVDYIKINGAWYKLLSGDLDISVDDSGTLVFEGNSALEVFGVEPLTLVEADTEDNSWPISSINLAEEALRELGVRPAVESACN